MKENKNNEKFFTPKVISIYVLVAIILFILFKTVILNAYIPSESMEPVLKEGQMVTGLRHVNTKDLKRYDIMIFKYPDDESQYYIKRIIGLPGEMIEVKDGSVYADGKKLRDDFIKEPMNTEGDGIFPVPKNKYFMMGDNRNNSEDSRYWNNSYVSEDEMVSKPIFRIWPITRLAKIK